MNSMIVIMILPIMTTTILTGWHRPHPPPPDPASRSGISIIHQNVGSPFRDNTPNLPEVIRTQKAQQMPTNVPQKGKTMKNAGKLNKKGKAVVSAECATKPWRGHLFSLETDPMHPRGKLKSPPPEPLSCAQFKLHPEQPLQRFFEWNATTFKPPFLSVDSPVSEWWVSNVF